jgi:sec-independent protein translocase protein TatA
MDIGAPELLIVLLIVVVVFGVGRVGKLGGELGSAIREFRRGVGGDKEPAATTAPAAPTVVEAAASPVSNGEDETAAHARPAVAH